jgi:hypothetical protein
MSNDINFKSAFDESLVLYKSSWKTLLPSAIIASVWFFPVLIPIIGWMLAPFYIPIVRLLLGAPFILGLYRLANSIGKNEKVKISDVFFGFTCWLNAVGGFFLVGIAVAIASLFFIIPGFYIFSRLFPAYYLLLEKDAKVLDCIKQAWEMTEKKHIELFLNIFGWEMLIIVCVGIISFLGIAIIGIIPFIGLILIPIWLLIMLGLLNSLIVTVFSVYYRKLELPAKVIEPEQPPLENEE